MEINGSVLTQEPGGSSKEKLKTAVSHDKTWPLAELSNAASELAEATEKLMELMMEPGVTPDQALEQGTELLSVYDEYLEVLETEIESTAEAPLLNDDEKESQQGPDDLIGLYLIFDYDREILRTVFGHIQSELLRKTDKETAPLDQGIMRRPELARGIDKEQ